jgi:DNA polymerase I-like protein with 3'-5' exonuclease and polymerase domains
MYHALQHLPKVSRNPQDILSLRPEPYLGCDAEWHIRTEVPTILGLSDGVRTVSVPFEDGKENFRKLTQHYSRARVVGHNYLSADLQVFDGMGIHTDPSLVDDTILYYWLTNAHLCKTTAKSQDDEGERRGAGYMNLWTMLSQYTDLWNYKACRGDACAGPCPDHDVYGYNGIDALGPVLAMPKLLQQAKLLGVDKLYPLHRKLALVLYEMRKTGILVDQPYVETLRSNFTKGKSILYDKETEEGRLPFNPDSPKQVTQWFKERGVTLKDTREETIKKLAAKYDLLDDTESTEEEPAGGGMELDEISLAINALVDWKAQGDGPDRWFAPRVWNSKKHEWEGYVDEDGYVHPRLGFYSSSGRMQCSNPNMQNVPARRRDPVTGLKMKVLIRKAIIAPPGYYLLKADYSNGENRIMLHLAGYDIPTGVDLHDWVRKIAGIQENSEFAKSLGGARDAAKSIQHAGNYLEGLNLLWPNELREDRIQREISAGARLVYEDWKFQDKIVTFTGTNLAKRAFGDASWGNRRKALEIAQQYFGTFPQVRDLQRAITHQAETENMVRPPNGYVTRNYGYPDERAKTACAIWGSQPLAHFTKLALLNLWQVKEKVRVVLQIHDELLAWVPNRLQPKYAAKLLREAMEVEVAEIPKLRIPAEPSWGRSWGEMEKVA